MLSTILRLADGTTVVLADALEGEYEYQAIVLYGEDSDHNEFGQYAGRIVTKVDFEAAQELAIDDEQMQAIAEGAAAVGPVADDLDPRSLLGQVLRLRDGTTVVIAAHRGPDYWYRAIVLHGTGSYQAHGHDIGISANDIASAEAIRFTDETAAALAVGRPIHGRFLSVEEMVAGWLKRDKTGANR
jgi:hypothetical protein